MAEVAAAALVGGTLLKAYGQTKQAGANAATDTYKAQVAENNAAIATQQAQWAGEEGDQSASAAALKTRATEGGIEANQAASGIDVNTGSAVQVQDSARILGKLDALTIRSNAARQAYGYQVEATNQTAQSQLDKFAAKNDIEAGEIGAGSTILGGAATGANYYNFLNSNSMFPSSGGSSGAYNTNGPLSSDSDVLNGG